jgi:hypothetical protein
VEVEIGPLRRPHQFGDVPRPDLVGLFQQFGFLVNGMTQLPAPLVNFAMLVQQPILRADQAMRNAVIQRCGVNFGGRQPRTNIGTVGRPMMPSPRDFLGSSGIGSGMWSL